MHSYLNRFWNLSTLNISALTLMLTLLATWQIQQLSRDWSLQQLHRQGEDRLLGYISTLRRDLNRFKPMPFVLTQSLDVRRLLITDAPELIDEVNLFLEQANQVSGTRSWEVLDPEGKRIASSDWRQSPENQKPAYVDKAVFVPSISGEYGGWFDPETSHTPLYYLSAPIYDQTRLIGIALISIDLNRLQESWTSSSDLLAISDTRGLIFLSSWEPWLQRHLPAPAAPRPAPSGNAEHSPERDTLPYRRHSEMLRDGTRITQLENPGVNRFLLQSVLLDDRQWHVHYLSDLAPLAGKQRSVVLFCLGAGLALTLIVLLLRERWLRSLSVQETAALRLKKEAQQRAIINNTQVGLITLDSQGLVRFINSRALKQFGTRSEQTLGQPIDQLLAPDQALTEVQQLSTKLAQQRQVQAINLLECLGLRADGSCFPIMMSINPIAWDDGDGYLVTLVDISKRKRAEQALQQANEVLELRVQQRSDALRQAQAELIQQSKLAALGTMSAAIAHELNQPLTAIRTSIFSTRLLLERQQAAAAEQTLEKIVQMTERMALITGQLKTFAHKPPQRLEPVPVYSTLEQVLSMFDEQIAQLQIKVQIEVQLEAQLETPLEAQLETPLEAQLETPLEAQLETGDQPRGSLQVWADQPRLEQVLINLIRNALDAMTPSTAKPLINKQPPQLTISIEQQAQQALIAIADTGPGLAEAALEQLFDPFFTTKDVGQGLGLGLSISYAIIRDLQGSIRASNLPGGGALFLISLPLSDPHTPIEPSPASPNQTHPSPVSPILINKTEPL